MRHAVACRCLTRKQHRLRHDTPRHAVRARAAHAHIDFPPVGRARNSARLDGHIWQSLGRVALHRATRDAPIESLLRQVREPPQRLESRVVGLGTAQALAHLALTTSQVGKRV